MMLSRNATLALVSVLATGAIISRGTVHASAVSEGTPSYADFVDIVTNSTPWTSTSHNSWIICYGYDNLNQRYVCSAVWGDTVTVAKTGNRETLTFSGARRAYTWYYGNSGLRQDSALDDQAWITVSDGSSTTHVIKDWYYPNLGVNSGYDLVYCVTNVDVPGDIFIDGGVLEAGVYYIDVTLTPQTSTDIVGKPVETTAPVPTSPPPFTLPGDWVADNTVPTEPTYNVDFVPSESDVQGNLDYALDEVNNTMLDYANGIRFWVSSLDRLVSDHLDLRNLLVAIFCFGVFMYIIWMAT